MTAGLLAVALRGQVIGELEQDKNGRFRLTYDDAWRNAREATPLSVSMPLVVSAHGHEVVEPFLWGLLPDNNAVLERWGRDFQVSPRNPFALLSHVGEDCAGAAQFVRPERIDAALAEGNVQWLTEGGVATRLRTLRADPTAWHATTEGGQFSLAGAQAKLALHSDGERWGIPSGRIPTTHILKPAVEGFDDHDLNEHLCLRSARQLGLLGAKSQIKQFDAERAIVVERYDRARMPIGLVRVHQEDFCQALAVLPTQKYQSEGGPSPLDIVTLLRDLQSPLEAVDAVRAFLAALAFNWLIAGTDAHAKNYSLLLSGPQVRLAPLYDVASALPYPHLDHYRLKLAMAIGGEYRIRQIAGRNWRRLARELEIDPEDVSDRILAMAEAIPGAVAEACADDDLAGLSTDLPRRLRECITGHVQTCQRVFSAAPSD